ncbi:DUF342 domain-containing protein [Brevibacillus daliensis]|uniref:DUF342 domain-containing protein n=1 Tax=Brevibacillus daliensis TaxID=2892995 RepID=UPI0035A1C943
MNQLAELATITVSKDKLLAELILQDKFEGQLLEDDVIKFCHAKGITFGLIENHIRSICANPNKFVQVPLNIAEGKEAIPGKDGEVHYLFQKKGVEVNSPKILEDGRVDFYSVLTIENVTKGQLLAEKILPTAGENGTTVTGESIQAKPGREAKLRPGKNVVFNSEKTLVYAVIDGQVSLEEDKISVFPVYEVNGDVDYSVGNINFIGTVVVRGNVPTGFSIKATGDIRIYGSVEGAELTAEGSIEIKNGIAGQDKGHVIAGNDVTTSYIQNGNVTAGNSVQVKQSIMFSRVRANKQVICQGTKGIIIGGVTQAGEKIVARTIGNFNSTPTTLEVGARPQSRQELDSLKLKLPVLHDNLLKTKQGLQVLAQILKATGDLPPDKRTLQARLDHTHGILTKEIKELEERKNAMEVELEKEIPAIIEVTNLMYPGAKLVFGKYIRFIKQEHSRTRFLLLEGEITTSVLI